MNNTSTIQSLDDPSVGMNEPKTRQQLDKEANRTKCRLAKEAMLFETTKQAQILIRARVGLSEEGYECTGILPLLASSSRYFGTLFREYIETDTVHQIHLLDHFKISSDVHAKLAFEYAWKIMNGIYPARMYPTQKRDAPQAPPPLTEAVWMHDLQVFVWMKRFADYFQSKPVFYAWWCELSQALIKCPFVTTPQPCQTQVSIHNNDLLQTIMQLREFSRSMDRHKHEMHILRLQAICRLIQAECSIKHCTQVVVTHSLKEISVLPSSKTLLLFPRCDVHQATLLNNSSPTTIASWIRRHLQSTQHHHQPNTAFVYRSSKFIHRTGIKELCLIQSRLIVQYQEQTKTVTLICEPPTPQQVDILQLSANVNTRYVLDATLPRFHLNILERRILQSNPDTVVRFQFENRFPELTEQQMEESIQEEELLDEFEWA